MATKRRNERRGKRIGIAESIVGTIIILFVAVFVMKTLYSMFTPNDIYKYEYGTKAIASVQIVNGTQNASYLFTKLNPAYEQGLSYYTLVKATIDNAGTTNVLVDVYLNDTKIATINASVGNNTYIINLSNPTLTDTMQVVLAGPSITGSSVTGQIVALTYPQAVTTTGMGANILALVNGSEKVIGIIMTVLLVMVVMIIVSVVK